MMYYKYDQQTTSAYITLFKLKRNAICIYKINMYVKCTIYWMLIKQIQNMTQYWHDNKKIKQIEMYLTYYRYKINTLVKYIHFCYTFCLFSFNLF